ncbi:MAG: DegT/DnrJ/EryC1/StrS family aminotransferase [Gemmatimonadaceae bacterium]
MFRRHQLPAHSPISAPAFIAALAGRALHPSAEIERARLLVASEFNADTVVLVDSGRSALRLAITHALSRPSSRIVALPAFQCYEVATAAVGADCGIALYDVDPGTLRPDLESVERALRAGAKAVVVAPLYGVPVPWEDIVALAKKHDAIAIEDAAQANGAEWKGRRLGSLGEVSVVSFGRGKAWSGGGGGALLLRGESAAWQQEIAQSRLAREGRVVALTMLQVAFGRPGLYGVPASIPALGLGETHYHEPTTPTGSTSFSAALLRRTLAAARAEAEFRSGVAQRWKESLPAALSEGIPPVLSEGRAGYLRFPLRLHRDAADRASVGEARRAGVARSYPRPLGELPPVGARLVEPNAKMPGAAALARELVTLPTHSRLAPRDFETILALSRNWS